LIAFAFEKEAITSAVLLHTAAFAVRFQ
jgi:hypothetical protein